MSEPTNALQTAGGTGSGETRARGQRRWPLLVALAVLVGGILLAYWVAGSGTALIWVGGWTAALLSGLLWFRQIGRDARGRPHLRLALLVTLAVAAVVLALPWILTDASVLERRLPVFLSLVGFDLAPTREDPDEALRHTLQVGPAQGKEAAAGRYLTVPWIPGRNAPATLDLRCTGDSNNANNNNNNKDAESEQKGTRPALACELRVALGPGRKDYHVSARVEGQKESRRVFGRLPLPKGASLSLQAPRGAGAATSGQSDGSGDQDDSALRRRRLDVRRDGERWLIGGCPLDDEDPLALLDLYFTEAKQGGGCALVPATDADALEKRWISRTVRDTWEIGAYSYLEMTEAGPALVLLTNEYVKIQQSSGIPGLAPAPSANQNPPAAPAPPALSPAEPLRFASGQRLRLRFHRRTFRLHELSEEDRADCVEAWDQEECQRFEVKQTGYDLLLRVSHRGRLSLEADLDDARVRQQLSITLAREELRESATRVVDGELGAETRPRTFFYSQGGDEAQRHRRLLQDDAVTLVEFPFDLSTETPYAAWFQLQPPPSGGPPRLLVHDSREHAPLAPGRRFALGGATRAIFEYEVARAPTPWLRGALAPWALAALCLLGLLAHQRRTLARIPLRSGLLTLALLLLGAFAYTYKGLLAFYAFTLFPHDWKAFYQFELSTLVLPLFVVVAWLTGHLLGSGIEPPQERAGPPGRLRRVLRGLGRLPQRVGPRWGLALLAALLVGVSLLRAGFSGREQLGGMRLAVFHPLLVLLYGLVCHLALGRSRSGGSDETAGDGSPPNQSQAPRALLPAANPRPEEEDTPAADSHDPGAPTPEPADEAPGAVPSTDEEPGAKIIVLRPRENGPLTTEDPGEAPGSPPPADTPLRATATVEPEEPAASDPPVATETGAGDAEDPALRPYTALALLALMVGVTAAWYSDKGAAILLFFPLGAVWLLSVQRHLKLAPNEAPGRRLLQAVQLAPAALCAVLLLLPGPIVGRFGPDALLQVPTATPPVCAEVDDDEQGGDPCTTPTRVSVGRGGSGASVANADLERGAALRLLQEEGLIAGEGNPRHTIRVADWLNDRQPDATCRAALRLPTREGLEVGFFRELTRSFQSSPAEERGYLRRELLQYNRRVVDPLLNDYLPAVMLVPQFPRGTVSTLAYGWLALWLLVLLRGWRRDSPPGPGWVVGTALLTLVVAGTVLTLACGMDIFPNFAQSVPFLAIRTNSGWLLDAFAVGLAVAAFAWDDRGEHVDGEDEEQATDASARGQGGDQ